MGRARRLHASAARAGFTLALTLAVLAVVGCGSSGSPGTGSGGTTSTSPASGRAPAGAAAHGCPASLHGVGELRAVGARCATAAEVAASWAAEKGCTPAAKASRSACTVGRYRCLVTSTDRGLAVGCARPGRSISFVARRG